ncbi:MAG: response regulator [Bacteroidia bacterium]
MNQQVKILLVEDNESDAEMTIFALNNNNLANKLKHVYDGAEAMDFLFAEGEYAERINEDMPKVILLDLKMPKLNGIELLQIIRDDKRTKTIPVVVLTSSKQDPDIKKCYALGVNSYVVKPVEFEDFQKAVSALGLYWMIVNQQPL